MSAVVDITGQTFERLTVIRRDGSNKHGQAKWLCACVCGKHVSVSGFDIRSGHTMSCGCLFLEKVRSSENRWRIHGLAHTPSYTTWNSMIERCTNPKDRSFHSYGGRGITVCPEWFSFERFDLDFGHTRPSPEYSMDRIDNDGGYHPGNVRWATREEQSNNKQNSYRITFRGETLTLTQWARRVGLSVTGLRERLERQWPLELAMSLPANQNRRMRSATPLPTHHQQEKQS